MISGTLAQVCNTNRALCFLSVLSFRAATRFATLLLFIGTGGATTGWGDRFNTAKTTQEKSR